MTSSSVNLEVELDVAVCVMREPYPTPSPHVKPKQFSLNEETLLTPRPACGILPGVVRDGLDICVNRSGE